LSTANYRRYYRLERDAIHLSALEAGVFLLIIDKRNNLNHSSRGRRQNRQKQKHKTNTKKL